MKYCNNCEQNVEPDGKVNWVIFALLFLFAFVPGLIYLFYCFVIKNKTCPQCGATNFSAPNHDHQEV